MDGFRRIIGRNEPDSVDRLPSEWVDEMRRNQQGSSREVGIKVEQHFDRRSTSEKKTTESYLESLSALALMLDSPSLLLTPLNMARAIIGDTLFPIILNECQIVG